MKKNVLLLMIALSIGLLTHAQVPQAVPYQAVARNAAGNLVANQNISIRLSILDGSAGGPIAYRERHTVTTNQFGLFTVNIGQGTILNGAFPSINWGVNAKYLKVELDPAGGNSFINMGTSQLLSVPYALFAGSASGANVPNGTMAGNTLRWNGSQWIADNGIYNDGLKIGLGTTVPGSGASPSAKLDIRDEDGNNSDISQTVAGAGFPALLWNKQLGTLAAPAAVTNGTFLGGVQGNYYNGIDYRTGAAMYYVADTTVGNWHPASIQFRTTPFGNNTNTTRMTIKHNGNIGIGTTSPLAKLDIRGNVKIQDGTEAVGRVFTSDATGTGSWQALPPGNVPNGTLAGNTLRWSGASWLADNAIFSDGVKVGLGTTAPGSGNAPTAKIDIWDEDGSNSDIGQTVAGSGFPALVWTKQLGTLAAPQALVKNTFVGGIQGNYYNGAGYNVGAAMYYIADTTSATSFPASIQFRTTGTDSTRNLTRMIIKHNGNVGIGTNNPEAKLDIIGKAKITDGTQGAGKVFTSDANGVGSWATLPGGNVPNGTLAGNTLRWDGTSWLADNALFSDGVKIGLGTTAPGSGNAPTAKIDIWDEDGSNSDIGQTVAGVGFPALVWTKQLGTLAAPEAVVKNTFIGGIQGNYFNGSGYSVGAAMYYVADTISATSFPASIQFRTTGTDSVRSLTRMIIKHNGKVGIGTTTPGVNGYNPYAKLDIRDETGENSDIQQLVAGGGIPAITWAQQGGTLAAPEPIAEGSVFGRLDGNYYTAAGYSQGSSRAASIFFRADTLVDAGNPGSIYFATARYGETIPRTNLIIKHNGNVGIGTQNPSAKLDVRGNVRIVDGTQGSGKVLTSDANGNASWQPASGGTGGGTPHVAFFAGNDVVASQAIPAATVQTVAFGPGYAHFNDGGGYSTATNRFTPPVPGVYQVNVTVNYQGTPGEIVDIALRFPAGHIIKGVQSIPAAGSGVITLSTTYNTNITPGPIWIEAYSSSAVNILKYESGFSAHLVYSNPL
jgi:hypothetical protein